MAEYDAFGRKKGDNPLEQLSSGPQPPEAAPVVPAPPAMPASSSSRTFVTIVGAAIVVALASIGVAIALLSATDGEDAVTETIPAEQAPPAPGTTRYEEPPPTAAEVPAAPDAPEANGDDGASLLTQPALERAVKALRVAELGRPMSFRLAADRINASLINGKGEMRLVQVGPDAKPRVITTTNAGQAPSMPWDAVDPAAPARLVRAAAEREKRSAGDVDYLVLLDLGEPTWGLFFKDGTHYQGDAAGKLTRRVN